MFFPVPAFSALPLALIFFLLLLKKGQIWALPPISIWIVKPGSLGDIVHALPCASAIRAQWPHAQISWVIDPRWATLLDGNTSVSHQILFPRTRLRGWRSALHAMEWAAGLLRRKPPEICLDLQGLLRSAIIARCSRAKHIFGLLPDPICPEFPLPSGYPPTGLPTASNWILLHPFARGEGKSLSESAILQFCEHFDSLPVLIAGIGELSPRLPSHCISLLNKTSLLEMIWLCLHAEFVVSVDSGPAHVVAAARGDRLLSLHIRSDPRMVGPYSPRAWIWQGGEIRRQNLSPHARILPQKQLGKSDMDYVASWLKKRLERP
ncbi:MAG: glycosyltransferase family 9 protein [Candidatus Xiphinematobacter sp.]|nr:MAG: glycosyltransferase family 9 protein [Candidatus Xiphinematobacter sp.]